MALILSPIIPALLGLVLVYLIYRLFRSLKHDLPLPPGPKGLPLIGNINDLPKPGALEWHHWLVHKDIYGPLSSITVLGQTFIIINDADIALEMLRDRAVVNSGRPTMVYGGEMIGWKDILGMTQANEAFKMQRKNIAKVASSAATLSVFDRVQEEESVHFLANVLASPENLFDHIRREAGAVILRTIYGYTPEAHGSDPLVDLAENIMADFADATCPGRYMVDMFPFLRYLPDWCPGTSFKALARQRAAQLNRAVEIPYSFVKQQMREKKHKTSYVSQMIEDVGTDSDMEFIHKWSATSLYGGGADTTVSALSTFFLAMALFPDVQKRAQEEIDRVVGPSRLPVSSDKPNLPFIWATVQETHRWHPVVPMSIPHASSSENVIRGYRIPKGAVLLPNTWWFTHDPTRYPNPSAFDPTRFLGAHAQPDPRTYTFGYGRRICPGRYVADNALIITIAQVLAVFDISKLPGEEPVVGFEPGIVSHPLPYRVRIAPRSEGAERLVMRSEGMWKRGESDARALERLERERDEEERKGERR